MPCFLFCSVLFVSSCAQQDDEAEILNAAARTFYTCKAEYVDAKTKVRWTYHTNPFNNTLKEAAVRVGKSEGGAHTLKSS